MKKFIFAFITLLSTSLVALSQTLNFGPEVGINLNNFLTNQSGYHSEFKTGLKAGINVNLPIGKSSFINTGLFYMQRGQEGSYTADGQSYKEYYSMGYGVLPFMYAYRLRLNSGRAGSIYLSAGPYIGYGFHGRVKEYLVNTDGNLSELSNDKTSWGYDINQLKPLDFGLSAGIRYELPFGLYTKAQYSYGLSNISTNENMDIRHHSLQLSIGLNFWTWVY